MEMIATNFKSSLSLTGRALERLDLSVPVNEMEDHKAMGLPSHYLLGNVDGLEAEFSRIFTVDRSALASKLEDPLTKFTDRIAIGHVLGLVGDPRINTFDPTMLHVPGYEGRLGLSPADIDRVVNQYKEVGIQRCWIEKECPEYEISLDSFKIAKYPVTNFEYLEFLTDTEYPEIPSSWPYRQYPIHRANHPVFSLSARACQAYADWLAVKCGRKFRLPSEAEWELSAGGFARYEYPWGNLVQSDCANTAEAGIFQTTPVGMFPKGNSPFGCSDMAGNVEEYVSDLYRPYAEDRWVKDNLVEINGDYHVARGGSFARFLDLARVRRRHGPNPKSVYAMGFRLAESL